MDNQPMPSGSMPQASMYCKCPHHKVIPCLVMLIGLVFLLDALSVITAMAAGVIWSIMLILIGFMMMMKGKCGCCKDHPRGCC